MRSQTFRRGAAALLLGATLALSGSAEAVIGRPLTPMSYAGVARRSTYRAAAYGGYRGYGGVGYGYGAGVAAGAATAAALTALPYGCRVGVACGGVVYQPVYQGTSLVYMPQ